MVLEKSLFAFSTLVVFLSACSPQPNLDVPAELKSGQKYFHRVCSNCHNSDAMGGLTKAPRLIDAEYLPDSFSDEDIRNTVVNGTNKMPSQKGAVSDREITEIIKYLRYSQKAAGLKAETDDSEEEDEEGNEGADGNAGVPS